MKKVCALPAVYFSLGLLVAQVLRAPAYPLIAHDPYLGDLGKEYNSIIPAGDEKPFEAAYTETQPADEWMNAGFNDAAWKKGMAPFGDNESTVMK